MKTNLFFASLNEFILHQIERLKRKYRYRHKNFFGDLREDAFGQCNCSWKNNIKMNLKK